jgi:hypothetical protein
MDVRHFEMVEAAKLKSYVVGAALNVMTSVLNFKQTYLMVQKLLAEDTKTERRLTDRRRERKRDLISFTLMFKKHLAKKQPPPHFSHVATNCNA